MKPPKLYKHDFGNPCVEFIMFCMFKFTNLNYNFSPLSDLVWKRGKRWSFALV